MYITKHSDKTRKLISDAGKAKWLDKNYRFKNTFSQEQHVKIVNKNFKGNVLVLGKYVNAQTKNTYKCKIHNKKFKQLPMHIHKSKVGCKECLQEKLIENHPTKLTHVEFVKKVNSFGKVKVIGKYEKAHKKIKCKCIVCKHVWLSEANNFMQGFGCPKCRNEKCAILKNYKFGSRVIKVQGFENLALNLLLKNYSVSELNVHSVRFVPTIKTKRFTYYPDFYIPKNNTIVEVKSTWTFLMNKWVYYKNCYKAKSCIREGYNFKLMLMQTNGKIIKLPKKWYALNFRKMKEVVYGS